MCLKRMKRTTKILKITCHQEAIKCETIKYETQMLVTASRCSVACLEGHEFLIQCHLKGYGNMAKCVAR
jgi:hypothetical protein